MKFGKETGKSNIFAFCFSRLETWWYIFVLGYEIGLSWLMMNKYFDTIHNSFIPVGPNHKMYTQNYSLNEIFLVLN